MRPRFGEAACMALLGMVAIAVVVTAVYLAYFGQGSGRKQDNAPYRSSGKTSKAVYFARVRNNVGGRA